MAHGLDDYREKGWGILDKERKTDHASTGWSSWRHLDHLNILDSSGRGLSTKVAAGGSWRVVWQFLEQWDAAKPTITSTYHTSACISYRSWAVMSGGQSFLPGGDSAAGTLGNSVTGWEKCGHQRMWAIGKEPGPRELAQEAGQELSIKAGTRLNGYTTHTQWSRGGLLGWRDGPYHCHCWTQADAKHGPEQGCLQRTKCPGGETSDFFSCPLPSGL